VGLVLNGTHQLLAYTDDVTLLGGNKDTIKKRKEKKRKETLIDASTEICLEINVDVTKYTLLTHVLNTGQDHEIMTAN
jgi:hypothetical protein